MLCFSAAEHIIPPKPARATQAQGASVHAALVCQRSAWLCASTRIHSSSTSRPANMFVACCLAPRTRGVKTQRTRAHTHTHTHTHTHQALHTRQHTTITEAHHFGQARPCAIYQQAQEGKHINKQHVAPTAATGPLPCPEMGSL